MIFTDLVNTLAIQYSITGNTAILERLYEVFEPAVGATARRYARIAPTMASAGYEILLFDAIQLACAGIPNPESYGTAMQRIHFFWRRILSREQRKYALWQSQRYAG